MPDSEARANDDEAPEDTTDRRFLPTPPGSEDGESVEEAPEERSLASLEQEIVSGEWDYDGKPEKLRTRFYGDNSRTVRRKNHLDSNVFHILARLTDKKIGKLKLLVYWCVDICGDLLTHADKQGLTGLHLAIQHRNYRMVRYVLAAYEHYAPEKQWNVDAILQTAQNGNNALHLAMKHMTPILAKDASKLATIEELIDKASAKTLSMQNQDGLTPLHLAVDGEKCTAQQLVVVRKLVEACDAALDVRGSKDKDKGDLSPYQYHQATYEQWQRVQARPLDENKFGHGMGEDQPFRKPSGRKFENDSESMNGDAFNDSALPREKPGGGGDDDGISSLRGRQKALGQKPGTQSQYAAGRDKSVARDQKTRSAMASAVGSNMKKLRRQGTMVGEMKGNDAAISQDQPTSSTSLLMASEESLHSLQKTGRQKDSLKAKMESLGEKPTRDSANEIAKYLKQTYLRKRSRRQALDFLYGGVSDTQVDFNLYGKEGEISEEDFVAGYQCAKLEDTLQRVCIPHLVIKPTPAPQPVGEQDDDHSARQQEPWAIQDAASGRTDLGIIFRWLRTDARVDKIIKLNVDDSHYPPHRDEEIERAVKPFRVEIWDWRKIDLCCETIFETAPDARQVNLYWSGNNAVLRGWSDPEGGLARLANLERVVVYPQSGIEGHSRNLRNFNSFKDRLESCAKRKTIQIKLADSENQLHAVQTTRIKNDDALQNHRWLKCMESFSRFIVNVRLRNPRLQPIKIAIIDDGIDTTERKLHNHVIGGQCFCAQDESPSFCVSAGGHGTMMARLVTRVFPQAQVISLKLDEHQQSDGTSQFSVQSAADAVRYAQRLGVSIINMSWSIEQTDANKDSLSDLQRAINMADESNILMFCSANDQGKTKDQSYPGQFSRGPRGTLCKIGAATATGGEYHYVSLDDVDFLFPGRVVEKEQDEDAADNATAAVLKDRSTEGSSLATAFASGLAGLILYVLQLVSLYCEGDEDELSGGLAMYYEIVKREPSKMKEIFRRLATTDKKFVEVWKVFENADELVRTGGRGQENRFRILAKICSELLAGLN